MHPYRFTYQSICHSTYFLESFFQDNTPSSMWTCPEHLLIFIYAGELIIQDNKENISVKKGNYIFIRHNPYVTFTKKAYKNEEFQSIFMGFSQCFLQNFHTKQIWKNIPWKPDTFQTNIIPLPGTPLSKKPLYILHSILSI